MSQQKEELHDEDFKDYIHRVGDDDELQQLIVTTKAFVKQVPNRRDEIQWIAEEAEAALQEKAFD